MLSTITLWDQVSIILHTNVELAFALTLTSPKLSNMELNLDKLSYTTFFLLIIGIIHSGIVS